MRDLSLALVEDIESARTFGNHRRLQSLATALRTILQLASKLPDSSSGVEPVCALCKTPMSIAITDADLELIDNFIARQKASGAFVGDRQPETEPPHPDVENPPLG